MINIYEPQTAKGRYVEVKFTCEEFGVDGCEGRVPACFAHLWERHFSVSLYSKNGGLWITGSSWMPDTGRHHLQDFNVGRGDSVTHPYIVVAFLPLLICSKNVAEL